MFVPLFVSLILLRLLRLSSRWTHSGRIVDTPRRRLGHAPETFWTHKKAQNRFRQFCASVFVPERFPAGAGCTFGVRTGRTLRSIVVVRPFCLRASAFPFGAAAEYSAVSPELIIRSVDSFCFFKLTHGHAFVKKEICASHFTARCTNLTAVFRTQRRAAS